MDWMAIYHHTQYDASGIASFLAGFHIIESEEEVSFDVEDIGIMEQTSI